MMVWQYADGELGLGLFVLGLWVGHVVYKRLRRRRLSRGR